MTVMIPLERIDVRKNDRTYFEPKAMAELAESIRLHGLWTPIAVFEKGDGRFEIAAGERRVRACRMIGKTHIEAVVRERDRGMGMLLENVMREQLDPIDEAYAYKERMNEFGMTAEQFSDFSGISIVRIRNRIALVDLVDEAQDLVRKGQLPILYARCMADAGLDANRQRLALARLNAHPSPSIHWFRALVCRLSEEQAQDTLLDLPVFGGELSSPSAKGTPAILPPDPAKTTPDIDAPTGIQAAAKAHAEFWDDAGRQWSGLGNRQKARECAAAANAIRALAGSMRQQLRKQRETTAASLSGRIFQTAYSQR